MTTQLSPLQSILNATLRRANGQRIKAIQLIVGELNHLTDQTIRSDWEMISNGTPAEGASLHIRRIDAELQCMACFQKYHPNSAEFSCPRCGSVGAKVISGEEFSVESVEVE